MRKQKTENSWESCTHGYLTNRKGITLVALIITIIVMIILAAVAITLAVGDNGVIRQGQNAGEQQKYKTEIELAESQVEYFTEGENAGKVDLAKTFANIKNLDEVDTGKDVNEKDKTYIDGDTLYITFKNGKKHKITGIENKKEEVFYNISFKSLNGINIRNIFQISNVYVVGFSNEEGIYSAIQIIPDNQNRGIMFLPNVNEENYYECRYYNSTGTITDWTYETGTSSEPKNPPELQKVKIDYSAGDAFEFENFTENLLKSILNVTEVQ